jgi:hypothetical protein
MLLRIGSAAGAAPVAVAAIFGCCVWLTLRAHVLTALPGCCCVRVGFMHRALAHVLHVRGVVCCCSRCSRVAIISMRLALQPPGRRSDIGGSGYSGGSGGCQMCLRADCVASCVLCWAVAALPRAEAHAAVEVRLLARWLVG